MWCEAKGRLVIPPVVARIFSGDSTSPLTREASVMAIFEGLLSFCNCCENGSIRCNGRSKQGKDALACVPKGFKHGCLQVVAKSRCRTHRPQTTTIAMDAKPTKHTQTLILRKASGIVQMQNWQSVHMARVLAIFEG